MEEPKLLPTAEGKRFPSPAPKGAWLPTTRERERARALLFWSAVGVRGEETAKMTSMVKSTGEVRGISEGNLKGLQQMYNS